MNRPLTIKEPVPYQVTQREGFIAPCAHEHEPGGPILGFGDVTVSCVFSRPEEAEFQHRVETLSNSFGNGSKWTALHGNRVEAHYSGQARLPAGGWYRLEVRCMVDGVETARASVEPVGVGEVFVIAGQSYAEGANDEHLRIEDPEGRVVAYDLVKKKWAVAHDPQPNLLDGGTIWPPMCNALLPLLRVPIGLVNVARGGTASREWLPGEDLYEKLAAAGRALRRFRAVLWQQGESDVMEKVETSTYMKNMIAVRTGLAGEWGFEPPWLLAKSTLHPMVYNEPAQEGKIRAAIDRLWRMPGFRPGPDTDILGGENRGGKGSRLHFSGIGQRHAGLMWCAAVWNELNRHETGRHPHLLQ